MLLIARLAASSALQCPHARYIVAGDCCSFLAETRDTWLMPAYQTRGSLLCNQPGDTRPPS